MTTFYAGKFYPPNPNSRVWKAGGFVDGVSASGVLPEKRGLVDISDVNDLQTVLDSKSDDGHQHTPGDISPEPFTADDNLDGGTFN